MNNQKLAHFPISFFSVVLGMTGLTIAWQKAVDIFGLPADISVLLLCISCIVFIVMAITYSVKMIYHAAHVAKEFHHPIKVNFFPTVSISLLLLSVAFLPFHQSVSQILWIAGSGMHFILMIVIVSMWIQHTHFTIDHMNPAWFIPAVGNILVPIAGVVHAQHDISWFFYSIGFFFWVALFAIFFNRIIFHKPLPEKLIPTLFILIAPPAIGFISLVKLMGGMTVFAQMLYFFALFLASLLFAQLRMFKKITFYLSWWAYSFPLAAMTIASFAMYHETQRSGYGMIAGFFFVVLNVVISILIIKTLSAMHQGTICVEE